MYNGGTPVYKPYVDKYKYINRSSFTLLKFCLSSSHLDVRRSAWINRKILNVCVHVHAYACVYAHACVYVLRMFDIHVFIGCTHTCSTYLHYFKVEKAMVYWFQ